MKQRVNCLRRAVCSWIWSEQVWTGSARVFGILASCCSFCPPASRHSVSSVFYTLFLTLPPQGLLVIGCPVSRLLTNWLNRLKFVNTAAGLFVLPTPSFLSCCDQSVSVLTLFFCFLSLILQNATRATIAAASEQGKNAPDASGWQRGGRGWHARTWRSKKTKEEERSAGIETKQGLKEERSTLMIVETKHLFFCLGSFRETLLATSRCYDVIAVPIVQLVRHQVLCVGVKNELIFRCIQCPSHNMHFTMSSHR